MINPKVIQTFGWLLGFPHYSAGKHAVADPIGPQERKKQLAQRLIELDVLQRKVVKQTVMTICYGVTKVPHAGDHGGQVPFISQDLTL